MTFLWSLTFVFYLLLFNHSLFQFSSSLPHLAQPFLPFHPPLLSANLFPLGKPILSTNDHILQWIPQTSGFLFALPSGTELRIHPSDGLLFLTRTLLLPPHHRPPSNLLCLSRTRPTGFHPKSQLLAPDLRASYAQSFRALWKTLLSTPLPFSRSLAVIPESLQRSLKVCQPPAAVGLPTSLPTTATVQLD